MSSNIKITSTGQRKYTINMSIKKFNSLIFQLLAKIAEIEPQTTYYSAFMARFKSKLN